MTEVGQWLLTPRSLATYVGELTADEWLAASRGASAIKEGLEQYLVYSAQAHAFAAAEYDDFHKLEWLRPVASSGSEQPGANGVLPDMERPALSQGISPEIS